MIYAKAHDQTVADDYFTAMQRVEQRLEIVPVEKDNRTERSRSIEVVKVREPEKVLQLIEQLYLPDLCYEDRLGIAFQLREWFRAESEPVIMAEFA